MRDLASSACCKFHEPEFTFYSQRRTLCAALKPEKHESVTKCSRRSPEWPMRAVTTQSGSKSCRSRSSPVRSALTGTVCFSSAPSSANGCGWPWGCRCASFRSSPCYRTAWKRRSTRISITKSRSSTSSSSRATAARTTL